MLDPLIAALVALDVLLGFTLLALVTHTIAVKLRTLLVRYRSRRWVRTLPPARPACPDMARRDSNSPRTAGVAPVGSSIRPVTSAIPNSERRRVLL